MGSLFHSNICYLNREYRPDIDINHPYVFRECCGLSFFFNFAEVTEGGYVAKTD